MKEINIEIRHLEKRYAYPVLKDISLNISNQSFITIYGKSGAGKSTLMNILGLLEEYDFGEYIFNDNFIKKGKDYGNIRGKYIGFIFQDYHLIPDMTCRENINLPLLYDCCNNNINCEELAQQLNIKHLLDVSVNMLSGGEKQRVAIARSLIRDPGLIIADEPTGNLDEKNKWIVYDILEREHKKGRAIIIITHDKEIVEKVNEKYMLNEGVLHEVS